MTKLYMLAPLTGLETFTDMSKAVNEAVRLTEEMGKQAGGFVVFEVVEIGRAEYARPLWISTANLARPDDEIPF